MAPRKRPETQKTPEVVVRPKSKRNRSPRELEPEAKKLCVKGPDIQDMGIEKFKKWLKNVLAEEPSDQKGNDSCFEVIGAGGSITGLKFNPLNTNQFFTSSMEGTTRLQDFKGNTLRVFATSDTCNLDVSVKSRVVVTGDNVGHVILLNMDGREVRSLKPGPPPPSLNPILAHFSPDGAQLLTTDQKSEIRVYSASQWDCPPHLIPHPHRHFQHLTPIKATWHPRYNLIVVGRYPDPNFKSCTPHELRTIDVFDGSSGKMMYQLYDPESSGIMSLNEFNPMGDTLASVMGYHILIWSQEETGMRK
ncbi:DNA damage-binding protein 2 [Camelus dromedarius]|uniref:DNA damage-binding protein 2 n=1 Tax=Camelus dromedarius TaxID=9838 RepID=A0A5N4DLI8_CAMDR|nr:DNA damage-binding protein 2 [Camelus dromedarius]